MFRSLNYWLLPAMLAAGTLQATSIYNETVSGDLSNNGLAPTALAFTAGSNQVLGATGGSSAGVDRDYFTFIVPAGFQIGRIVELAGTQVGGATSFIGLQAGPQLTLPTSATSAAGLLGWDHYGAVSSDLDILPAMSIPNTGSSGFSSLPSGQYTLWIQDFNSGKFSYGFDVNLTATPEPGTYALVFTSLSLLAVRLRKRAVSRLS